MSLRTLRLRNIAAAVALCAVSVPQLARAQYIDLPGTQPGGLATDAPLEQARVCGTVCHFSRDPSMLTAQPYDTWLGSMMGNTMRDPLYLAALTVAEQDHPGVGDYCLRCHTPPGFVAGHTRGNAAASRGESLDSGDRDGVTCDSCHRMVATTNLGNAQFQLSPTETRFGPYPTIVSIRHMGAVSTWLADSRMCATCHEITNPLMPQRNADGTDTGRRFPLDTTYSEWANSAYAVAGSPEAATCQDCHLPRQGRPDRSSTNKTAMLRDNPRRHDFTGANVWGMRVLAAMRDDVTAGEFYDPDLVPYYEAGARRAEASLRSAVTLEMREAPPTTAMPGQTITFTARITNRSGHRVPTGYGDARRMWLDVALVDPEGHETMLSGAYDMAEAHLDTADTQLRVYEAIHGRAGMGREEHIALHDTVIRDTRLPPKGYRPLPGHEPVGVDYSGGEGGALRHWDDARYTVTLPPTAHGASTLRVRARYQTTTREYVEFLAHENHTDMRGMDLLRRYEASGRAAPNDMATVTAPIMLPAAADAGPPDTGVRDTGVTDATATDGNVTDLGPRDVVVADTSVADVQTPDVAALDAGADATPPTPSMAAGGCHCDVAGGATGDARGYASLLTLAAVAGAMRPRRRRAG